MSRDEKIGGAERATVAKCERSVAPLSKVLERLDEAESLYGVGRKYAALSKVSGAFTSLALAYSKDLLDEEDWKNLSAEIHRVRMAILREEPTLHVFLGLDKAREIVERKLFEKFAECLKK